MQEDSLQHWFKNNEASLKKDFFTLLEFPSISTDPKYRDKTLSCANWLVSYLNKMPLKTSLIETPSYPIVYAENLEAGKGAPTLLIYGHYDVQPVDPLDEWTSDPFKPEIRQGQVYARGALDNKGQLMYTLAAFKALFDLHQRLPVNLKLCLEGEEEAGSRGLAEVLPKIAKQLKADYLLVPDVDIPAEDTPAITLGARGIVAFEITLQASNIDLHSGQHGGLAFNPNRALAELIAQLWNQEGRVQIPGFYDQVVDLTPSEKAELNFDFDEKAYTDEFGIYAFGGRKRVFSS